LLTLWLNIDIQTILNASDVTEEEAELAVEAFQEVYKACETLSDNFKQLYYLFTNASSAYENQTWVEATSSFTCGKKNEFIIGDLNFDNLFDFGDNEEQEEDKEDDSDEDNNKSKYDSCETFVDVLNKTDEGKFFWGFFGHVVRGKVLYSPNDDNFTQTIMEEANKTFIELGVNIHRINQYASLGVQLNILRTMQNDLEIVQDLCENETIRQMLIDYGVDEVVLDVITGIPVEVLIQYLEDN
jgi:hypothetical protein